MKLDPNEEIAGYKARAIRDLLKGKDWLDAEDVQRALRCGVSEAKLLLSRLVELGKLKAPVNGSYEMTLDGHQLGGASFRQRMPRARAAAMLDEVLRRAADVNARVDLTDRISEIRVFGSYLTDAADLGDLDIAVTTERRPEYKDHGFVEANQALADASGRRLNYVQRLGFSELEIKRLLKAKLPGLSLHEPDELVALGVEGRVVFPTSE